MRTMFCNLILLFVASVLSVEHATAQRYCRVRFTMLNSTRHVVGEVNEECAPSWHSSTWGNWGVESNFGGKTDTIQFAGWKWEDTKYQWDSCTGDHIRDTDCIYYNHDHNGNGFCEDQGSDTEYWYATGYADFGADCPFDYNNDGQCDIGGCRAVMSLAVSGQYLELYELDWDGDDYIATIGVHSECCRVSGITCTPRSCYGPRYSSTYPTVWIDRPLVNTTANVRMRFDYGWFEDAGGYCAKLAQWDRRYACN